MKGLVAVVVALGVAAAASLAAAGADGRRWWSYVEALANDQMAGRNTGSPEHLTAAEYVASQFDRGVAKQPGTDSRRKDGAVGAGRGRRHRAAR
jgi:hypothetical protein